MPSDRWSKANVTAAVENNVSIAGVLRDMGLKASGGNYRQFHRYAKIYSLDLSHFTGQAHLKGKTHNWARKIPDDEIFVKGSTYNNGTDLRKRILGAGLLEYECAWCGISEWRGEKLTLHVDHINGDPSDNRIENLRFLCPNCHSQTDTYAGKNSKIGRAEVNACNECETPIDKRASHCKSCAGKLRESTKIQWPPCKKLVRMVKESNYSAVSRELGVSDNAVRKRLKNHFEGELP